jgi:hypothetical protein
MYHGEQVDFAIILLTYGFREDCRDLLRNSVSLVFVEISSWLLKLFQGVNAYSTPH